jgi:putative membrane protein
VADRAAAAPTRAVASLVVLTVACQIAYPLVHGAARDRLTVLIVLWFAAASVCHAAASRRVALPVLAATAVPGFVAELVGVHSGFPFGHYAYAPSLGARIWGVPIVIALAWTMFAWPAALVARRLAGTFWLRVAIGAWALVAWDLFLDPQMVAAGHWRWRFPSPSLPGVDTVPLTNYAGWLLVSAAVSLLLQLVLRAAPDGDDRWMFALFLWTWLSSGLALGAFLGLPAAAGWGLLGLGLVAVPLIGRLR